MLRLRRLLSRATSLYTESSSTTSLHAFGPFRALHQVGAGALGPVIRAFDPDSEKLVAVKILRIPLAPERVDQVVEEIERLIGARLTHPVIVTPVAGGKVELSPYLVQPF